MMETQTRRASTDEPITFDGLRFTPYVSKKARADTGPPRIRIDRRGKATLNPAAVLLLDGAERVAILFDKDRRAIAIGNVPGLDTTHVVSRGKSTAGLSLSGIMRELGVSLPLTTSVREQRGLLIFYVSDSEAA